MQNVLICGLNLAFWHVQSCDCCHTPIRTFYVHGLRLVVVENLSFQLHAFMHRCQSPLRLWYIRLWFYLSIYQSGVPISAFFQLGTATVVPIQNLTPPPLLCVFLTGLSRLSRHPLKWHLLTSSALVPFVRHPQKKPFVKRIGGLQVIPGLAVLISVDFSLRNAICKWRRISLFY